LGLSLLEPTVECSFKDGRVIAGDLLVEAKRLFGLVFACIQLDDVFGIPVTHKIYIAEYGEYEALPSTKRPFSLFLDSPTRGTADWRF
jgi:hypothetical protein